MDIKALRDGIERQVKERGGLSLRGWIEVPGDEERGEPLTVHVEEDDPSVWATLSGHATPPAAWVSEKELILGDDLWTVQDGDELVPLDIQDQLEAALPRDHRKIETLRGELRTLCLPGRIASLTVAVLVNGVLYEGEYQADWVGEVGAKTAAIEEILSNVIVDPEKRQARERALERERKTEEQDLEQQVVDTLLANPDFVGCTTKGQRLSFARAALTEFAKHPGYEAVNYRLGDIAEVTFVKAKKQAKP